MRTQTSESGTQTLKLAALQSLLNVVWRTRNADEMPLWVLVKLDCRSSVRIQAPTEKADINVRGHVSSEEMLLAIRLSANLSLHKGELLRILSEKRKCFLEIGLNQIIVPYLGSRTAIAISKLRCTGVRVFPTKRSRSAKRSAMCAATATSMRPQEPAPQRLRILSQSIRHLSQI